MSKTIGANIRQAVFSRGFMFGLFGIVAVILMTSVDAITNALRSTTLLSGGFHAELIFTALNSNNMSLTLPILCTLPFAASFVDDTKSGFIKEYLPRINVRRYISGKLIGCAISGGLVVALGVFFTYVAAALVLSPSETAQAHGGAFEDLSALTGSLLLFFFSGAFWSVTGMTFAALTGSKYMAYASPFVLFYTLTILYERYFNGLYVLYPKEWLHPSEVWIYGNLSVIILLTELTIIAALGFATCARKRIDQL